MTLKTINVDIPPEAPFANCQTDREQYALILTDILANYNDGFVLAINNKWGTGKTTFIKMWKQHLKNLGFRTVYFNAWENDTENNILITLMAELKALLNKTNTDAYNEVISKATPLLKSFVSSFLKTQIEKHVGKDFLKDILQTAIEVTSDNVSSHIDQYSEKKINTEEFKKSLTEFVKISDDCKPVVFIIDELDRCRPNYAVELLEQIKHIFSVPGVVFVLSIDKIQLGHAIKGVYGSRDIDSDEYLRRFIDIEYSLPEPKTELFTRHLYNAYGFSSFFNSNERSRYPAYRNDEHQFLSFSTSLFSHANVPLRLQEKTFAHCRLAMRLFQPNQVTFPILITYLTYLKLTDLKTYTKIAKLEYSFQELVNAVENTFPTGLDMESIRIFLSLEALIIYVYNNSLEYSKRIQASNPTEFKNTIYSSLDPASNDNFYRSFQRIQALGEEVNNPDLEFFLKKIALADSFKF